MKDITDRLQQWHAAGERIALATVIAVHGSAPRAEGAKMLITQSGKIAGSVSGGCVEAAVAEEAQRVLDSGEPAIARYGINRNMMWDVGLSCGGTIEVFIEPALKQRGAAELLDVVQGLLQGGKAFAVCTLVRPQQTAGAKALVVPGQGVVAVSAGWALPVASRDALIDAACQELTLGQSRTITLGAQEVFIDVSIPNARLVIVGAVHIATALCEMAALNGFEVIIVDPRAALNNRERFPKANELRVGWPEDELPRLRLDENTYVAVLTHDEKFDDPTVSHALRTPVRYLGAIGSKKTQALRRERLLAAGLSHDDIARLRGPIGLDIGAQTPEEIAVAILSEMIAAKYQRSGAPLRDRSEPHIHV